MMNFPQPESQQLDPLLQRMREKFLTIHWRKKTGSFRWGIHITITITTTAKTIILLIRELELSPIIRYFLV